MLIPSFSSSAQLRSEIALRNLVYAQNHSHVQSFGSSPVVVYAPENGLHGNFHPRAYQAVVERPEWMRRFDKIHAQGRSLPRSHFDPTRKWRELDSCMSSDALLMNIFCTPEVAASPELKGTLGIAETESEPAFGWKARVPLKTARFDRTEVDMRWGDLLVEAKLTETDFQCREAHIVESYRDFEQVFDCALLRRVGIRTRRRREAVESSEEFTQEWEQPCDNAEQIARTFQADLAARADADQPWQPGYASYQLIRNVLAAYATAASFCVIHDERRPDLREAWFSVMSAVRIPEMRGRCKVITWQEMVPLLPQDLREFLDVKYGIVAPGDVPSAIDGFE